MKKLLALFIMSLVTSSTFASFDTTYTTFVDRVSSLSNLSFVESLAQQGKLLDTTMDMKVDVASQEKEIKGTMQLSLDSKQTTTGTLATQGSINLNASGISLVTTGAVDIQAKYALKDAIIYAQLQKFETPITMPSVTLMTSLLKDKWLQIPLSGAANADAIQQSLQDNALSKQKKMITSLKSHSILTPIDANTIIQRNGYEIYPITIHQDNLKQLMQDINPANSESLLPLETENKKVKNIALLAQKGDEIKMVVLSHNKMDILSPKKAVMVLNSSKSGELSLNAIISEKKTTLSKVQLHMNKISDTNVTFNIAVDAQDTTIKATATIHSSDAGSGTIEIPKESINLETIIGQAMKY